MSSTKDLRASGHAMVAVSYGIMGSIGAVVTWAPAPASTLLLLRMGVAAVVLSLLFARPRMWREIRRPGVVRLLLVMALLDASALLLFFVSTRLTNVAVAMFLVFLSPLWVALLAPRVLGQRTDRVVWPGLALAMGGLSLIVVPPAIGEELTLSVWGLAAGLLSGVLLAGFMMVVSELRRHGLRSASIVVAESALDTLIVLPLAAWQTWISGPGLTTRDLIAGLVVLKGRAGAAGAAGVS